MFDLQQQLFVFEMANNHQGSVDHGLRIVAEMGAIARRHGVRAAVKLQYRDLDTFIHPTYRDREGVPHIPRFLSTQLSRAEFRLIISEIRDSGMTPLVTPFDETSVAHCVEDGLDVLKVASCSATDWPLLEAVTRTGLPVIVSTGGLPLPDIDSVASYLRHCGVPHALLHCVAAYPAAPETLSLHSIERMRRRYRDVPIGYSGHEDPDCTDATQLAVAMGATILERHVGVPTGTISLNKYSSNPEQADAWVHAALQAQGMCGGHDWREPLEVESASILSLRRGVYARRPVAAGRVFTADDVYFAMPCQPDQTTSSEFGRYRTQYAATTGYTEGDAICERVDPGPAILARGAVHEVLGMLAEAGIRLGEDAQVELSHQYGLERLRETGAVLITVVNRGYCKKLLILLPGQSHPVHHHQRKEETFCVLSGTLSLKLDDVVMELQPGQKVTVMPGCPHAFWTTGGVIFEEISDTHARDDSFYEDPDIQALDPMQRKTIVERP